MDRKKRLRQTPIAREGLKFIIPSLVLSIIFYIFFYYTLAFLSFFFLLFCLFFFRNPKRSTNEPGDCLISPADGKVTEIKEITEDEFLGSEAVRVSIFMSLASVHVNPGKRRSTRRTKGTIFLLKAMMKRSLLFRLPVFLHGESLHTFMRAIR